MAAFNKFDVFTYDAWQAKQNFASDTYKVALSNTAPTSADAVFADIVEIAAGSGYTAGGAASAMTLSTSGGTAKVVATDVTFTSSGTLGPFRYVVVYNATQTSPLKPLVGWYDYGSSVTLSTGETFTVDFDPTTGMITDH